VATTTAIVHVAMHATVHFILHIRGQLLVAVDEAALI
jgi:hypothetical protein